MDVVDIVAAAVRALTADTARLGISWTMKTATVTVTSPLQVVFDGDTVAVGVSSMVGNISGGSRVYVIAVPPAGNYICGLVENVSGVWAPVTFQNGWTNGGGAEVTMQYRLLPSPLSCVQVVGEIVAGTKTDGTVIFTLPAGFIPAHVVSIPVATLGPGGAVGATTPILQFSSTTGNASVFGINTGAISRLYINALIPLEA